MNLILYPKIDLGGYIQVLNVTNRLQQPLRSVRHIDWQETNLGTLGPSETLYISGHGNNSEIEGRDPDQLAKELVGKGLKNGVQFKKIKLLSCGSGITTGIGAPYCQRLAAALAKNGGPPNAVVVGFDGSSTVCDQKGISHAKDVRQADYATWSAFVANHQASYNKWDATAKNLSCKDQTQFFENALMLISIPEVRAAFEWLYRANENYIKAKSIGKTYSDPAKSWKKQKT
jgi:hypothetical protein